MDVKVHDGLTCGSTVVNSYIEAAWIVFFL
jgi:hypothetical protein